jgi:hypothetical protein
LTKEVAENFAAEQEEEELEVVLALQAAKAPESRVREKISLAYVIGTHSRRHQLRNIGSSLNPSHVAPFFNYNFLPDNRAMRSGSFASSCLTQSLPVIFKMNPQEPA